MPPVLDLTPKFQAFYRLALHADPDTRWALWQQHYGFAAVPPTPEGLILARDLLDGAWERYGTLPADLRAEAARLEGQVTQALGRLEQLFGVAAPDFRLVTYVGGFEGNAFVAHDSLCLPVEMPGDWITPVATHELAHVFHHSMNGSDGGWTRTLAAVIVEEGVATRTVDSLYPDLPTERRVGAPDWLDACAAARSALIDDALENLARDDDDTLMRFTLRPHHATGLGRSAYALGWWLVGEWLAGGRTVAELARVPESELPALVRRCWT